MLARKRNPFDFEDEEVLDVALCGHFADVPWDL